MIVAAGFAGALVLALVCWRLLRPMLAGPAFQRENFRGARLPVVHGYSWRKATMGSMRMARRAGR